MKHGVHHYGAVLSSRKEWRTLGDERQHCQAQVSVQRQRHLRGAESGLGRRVGTSGPLLVPGLDLALGLDNSEQTTQASDLSPKPAPLVSTPLFPAMQTFNHANMENPINDPS